MAIVVNIVSEKSGVGKTTLMVAVISELSRRGFSVASIKHDAHTFDIDIPGKDSYKHRQAGAKTVIISSKTRLAIIKETTNEYKLQDLINMASDKDIILIEGYKSSQLKKIEVYRKNISEKIITPIQNLLAIATDCKNIDYDGINYDYLKIDINNYVVIANIIEKQPQFKTFSDAI